MRKTKPYILVTLQFGLLIALAWYGSIFGGWLQNTQLAIAIALGIWAIASMHFNVSVLPDVRDRQELIVTGPYTYIRHPMYTAVLLAGQAWMQNNLSFVSAIMWLALLAVLLIKLDYEETQLLAKFKTYKKYKQKTKRLIPFIY